MSWVVTYLFNFLKKIDRFAENLKEERKQKAFCFALPLAFCFFFLLFFLSLAQFL